MLLLLAAIVGVAYSLTDEEIAAFKPRLPDHIERNTGLKARYSVVDNGDGSVTFDGNSIPPHDTWVFPRKTGNPFPIKEVNWTMSFNKEPIFRKTPFTCLPHGAIGVTTTGMVISSNFPSEKGCPYVPNFEELDICDGHPSPGNDYHHHYYSHCIDQPTCGEPSPIVGVAIDGIPIYGPYDEFGRQLTGQDTDQCGGRVDSSGRYKYHMTIDPPFFMDCLWGEIRNDIGTPHDMFFCTCPYDDTALGVRPDGDGGPPALEKRDAPPGPKRELVCDFSGPKDGMAVCEDKYNTTYDLGREWAREWETIDLAPCCPKGSDCGYSCKTDDGIKPECFVEKRRVLVSKNVEKGYCQYKCHDECGRNRRCMDWCMNTCWTPKGKSHDRKPINYN